MVITDKLIEDAPEILRIMHYAELETAIEQTIALRALGLNAAQMEIVFQVYAGVAEKITLPRDCDSAVEMFISSFREALFRHGQGVQAPQPIFF